MTKRKIIQANKSSVNPLSDARRAQQRSDNEIATDQDSEKKKMKLEPLSKADLKAKELWHRKSGAGYHLFVEYYGGQPKGVVYDDSDVTSTPTVGATGSCSSSSEANKQGKGMSRAAKRRKKKNASKQKETSAPSGENGDKTATANSLSPKFEEALKDKPECRRISSVLSSMSVALPLTLRIRHPSFVSKDLQTQSKIVIEKLERNFSQFVQAVGYDGSKNTIYQAKPNSGVTKFSLGKISPDLKALIVQATASGIMARQELGSMLPVIALAGINQLKYGSRVLDMCASPGSKTLQALEIVASSPIQPPKRKKGRIVANDIHPLRLDSLRDAIGRSGVCSTLTDRIVYVNNDASKFPTPKSGTLFDCIIADVPCSGDGTIRKDPHILPGWMPSISNSLHELQLNILKRAIKLLKVGGVVAYSTCSLNPIEDEAVVEAALSWGNRHEDDSVELLDWPENALPGFKRRPGVNTWRVANYHWGDVDAADDDDLEGTPKIQWYETFERANNDGMVHACESMWPPERADSNLSKCMRLLPQDNDTGGFFVALIRKNRDIGFVKHT